MTPLETASRLNLLAIRATQQTLALQFELGAELLRLIVEILGADEVIRRAEAMRTPTERPPPSR